ncbi:MAG: nuclear transport factor 2 family protein [Tepidiformaceae bacterium]
MQQLYARYNHAIHVGDGALWANCFTLSATFSNTRESVTGRTALAAYATEFSKGRRARYWINNLLLEPRGSHAQGSCYLLILHIAAAGDTASIQLTGVYTDAIARTEHGWLFETRHVAADR